MFNSSLFFLFFREKKPNTFRSTCVKFTFYPFDMCAACVWIMWLLKYHISKVKCARHRPMNTVNIPVSHMKGSHRSLLIWWSVKKFHSNWYKPHTDMRVCQNTWIDRRCGKSLSVRTIHNDIITTVGFMSNSIKLISLHEHGAI